MDYYEVTAPFARLHGKLRLTDSQAQARQHNISPLGDNVFETREPCGFKKGEIVGYADALPKALRGCLVRTERDFDALILAERDARVAKRAAWEAGRNGNASVKRRRKRA